MGLMYPSNLEELLKGGAGSIMFSLYDRPNSQSSSLTEIIQLYLPNDLRNPMNINWEQTELGSVGGSIVYGEGTWDRVKGFGAHLIKKGLEHSKTKAATEKSQGYIANPYMAMTFKSLGFRKFKMEFKFTPHNAVESGTIHDIIKKFRETALPEGSMTDISMGYPGEIEIMYVGACHFWLPRFKRSVITDIDINYAGQGFYAGMENGFPAETIMTIEFTENELVFRDDVGRGY